MSAPRAQHPSPDDLTAFAVGRLGGAAAAAVAAHLEKCPACRRAAVRTPAVPRARNARPAEEPTCQTAVPSSPPPALCADGLPPELAGHPRYRILRELGRGGMGVVYHAEQTMMDRQVAIKVISGSLLASADALERFRREVRAAARLVHPNIVVAYDAEQAGDLHMLVMEFVPGQTLAQVLQQKGTLPVALACHYVRQAALGLQHAFEQGMVHRDIKPQNLMLTPKGQVKVLDFGLAKLASERGGGQGLTAVNAYMGTPEYSAPEQAADARDADIRADLYSLGCTLYCLLAGRPPFQGGTAVQTILAHLDQAPRPLPEVRPEVPAGLWAIVARLLAKDKAQRYQKPVEVAQALAPFCKPRSKVAASPAVPVGVPPSEQVTTLPRDTGPLPVVAKTSPQVAAAPVPGSRHGRSWWVLGCLVTVVAVLGLAGGLVGGLLLRASPSPAAVILEIDPPDAAVFVDGQKTTSAATQEPLRLDLPAGTHDLRVEKEGFATSTRQVTLEAGKTERLQVRLETDRVGGSAAPARPAGPPHPDGFVPLFNGKDLSGWSVYGGGTGAWKVIDGAIVSSGPASYLYTRRADFHDFDLIADVMINDGGNSGLLFRTTFAPGLPDGFEAQIHCTARDLNRTGSLYIHRKAGSYYPVRSTKVLPNEWFRYEVSTRGNHIVLKVNGTKVLDHTEEPKSFSKGHIALRQYDPATVVRFRTVDVKELPPPRAAGGH
jgi:hypothetical protein